MSRLRTVFYVIYAIYFVILLYLCIKLLQVPDATEDAFYLYLKDTFGGYFGVISFLENYFRSFQIFVVLAVIISFVIILSDFFGKAVLRRKVSRLESEVNALKAKLYDKQQTVPTPQPSTGTSNLPPQKK